MRRIWGWMLAILLLLPLLATAQDPAAVDSLFYDGVGFYKKGQYDRALERFDLVNRIYPGHSRTTAALLMRGKSLYRMGDDSGALDQFGALIREYPASAYVDDAYYGIAQVHAKNRRFRDAAKSLMKLVDMDSDSRLLRRAAKHSSDFMDQMDIKDLQTLYEELPGEKARAAVVMRLAQKEIDDKHYASARRTLQGFITRYPQNPYNFQMEKMLADIEPYGEGVYKVGVILPITGGLAQQGQQVLDGIRYAVAEHNANSGITIELDVRDSKSKMIDAIRAAQSLCQNDEVFALIGELESDISSAVAAVAQSADVPIIAPTATVDGLTSLGESVFQANNSRRMQASTLAEYAVSGLGQRRFAVLYPADDYGQAMRDGFVETVLRLGGEIITEQHYYDEGVEDLGRQFKALRDIGIRQMLADSLIVRVSKEEWEDEYQDSPVQNGILHVHQTISDLVDSTELAVTPIEGLYIPARHSDLIYLMPQIAYFNFDTYLFGGSFWYDTELMEENKDAIDGLYFSSDYYIDPFHYAYTRFRDAFRKKTGKTPEKLSVLGVDATRLLLTAMKGKALNRKSIRQHLSEVTSFEGIHGTIAFDKNRVNQSVRLLQFKGGRIIQIK